MPCDATVQRITLDLKRAILTPRVTRVVLVPAKGYHIKVEDHELARDSMPTVKGFSKKAISANISTEIKAGKPHKVAVAEALNIARTAAAKAGKPSKGPPKAPKKKAKKK